MSPVRPEIFTGLATTFSATGNIIFANFHSVKDFCSKLSKRRSPQFHEQAVKTGQIVTMRLIDEILHHVVFLFIVKEINAKIMGMPLLPAL